MEEENYIDQTWKICKLDDLEFYQDSKSYSGHNKWGERPRQRLGESDYQPGGRDADKISIQGFLYAKNTSELFTKVTTFKNICSHHPDNPQGQNYLIHRLSTPLYPDLNIKIENFTISDTPTEWGIARISLDVIIVKNVKEIDELYKYPGVSKNSIENFKNSIQEGFSTEASQEINVKNVTLNGIENFKNSISNTIKGITDSIRFAQMYSQNIIELANITKQVNEISTLIDTIVYSPAFLTASFNSVLNSFKKLNMKEEKKELWKILYDSSNLGKDLNSIIFNKFIQSFCYTEILGSILEENIYTNEQINFNKQDIDNLFNYLNSNYSYNYKNFQNIKKIRLEILSYLNELEVGIVDIFSSHSFIPATVLSYLIFEDINHNEIIANLNKESIFLRGNIKYA